MKWNNSLKLITLFYKKQILNKWGFLLNSRQSLLKIKNFKRLIKVTKRYRILGIIPFQKTLTINIY